MKRYITLFLFVASLQLHAQSGITWNAASMIAAGSYDNLHPRVAADRAGNPMVIWGRASDESVFFSKWNGTMFTTPVKLNPSGFTVATASWMGPNMASHGDTVYVVVKKVPEADTSSHIYLIRSFNGGQTFSAPIRVDYIGDSLSRFPTVTTDFSGRPIVAFMKFNASFGDSRWVVTRSTDFGTTFTKDFKVSGWGGSAEVCDCCPGAIVNYGNAEAVLYRNNNLNRRDVWMGLSTNNGTSYTSGANIDNHNWMYMSCPASGPDAVVIGDTLYSVFMNGAVSGLRNYISKYSIGSGSMGSVSGLGGVITGLGQQNFPRIASYGTAVAVVWQQTVSSVFQLPVYFTNDIRKGFPMKYDTVDLAYITNTDVVVTGGGVHVVWQDDNANVIRYRSGNYTAAVGIEERKPLEGISISPNPAKNKLWIENLNEDGFSTGIAIVNTLGQKVYLSQAAGMHEEIDITNLAPGIYYVVAETGKGTFTKKFIKE
jgi:hypothetical protein